MTGSLLYDARLNHFKPAIDAWRGLTAFVVGDAIIDRYHFGHVTRLSPEAPVPVFVTDKTETRDGGAMNVAANLRGLGLHVEHCYGRQPWSQKTRYVAGSHQLLRVDEDQKTPIAHELADLEPLIRQANVVVISDYAKGTLTPAWCSFIIGAAIGLHIPVVVDPKGENWDKYTGATVVCPNEAEFDRWQRSGLVTQPVFETLIVKLGDRGLQLMTRDRDPDAADLEGPVFHHVRTHATQARHVFDVTGAGDTVCAVIAACLASGAPLDIACDLANAAASVVIAEVGTSVCTRAQLLARLTEGA